MTDYTKLCAALRKYSQSLVAYKLGTEFADAVNDAADAIERLQADNIEWRKKYIKSECDAINQTGELVTLHAENADLRRQLSEMEYRLMAVMHSVDKWFEEIPDENEETRAVDAREIALSAIEILKIDNAELKRQLAEKTELLDKAVERINGIEEALRFQRTSAAMLRISGWRGGEKK